MGDSFRPIQLMVGSRLIADGRWGLKMLVASQQRDSEWVPMDLGELCDFRGGSAFTPAFQGRTVGDYPFIKVSDMNLSANAVRIQAANNWVSKNDLHDLRAQPFPPGTVVFAKIGEALRQNRRRRLIRETIIDNNMMGAVPHAGRVDPLFLYYALSQFRFSEVAQGTALPYLTVATLSALKLSLPPLPKQHAIAHILGSLDDKIELNRRMNETLEAMVRALFKSWFVEFAPVRAKMEGRETGLSGHIANLFPGRMVDSELGEIPAGWEVSTIGQEVNVVGGSTPSTKVPSFWNGTMNWATPKDLSSLNSPILMDTSRKITESGLAKISSGLLPQGTVLLSSRAPIGYLAIADIPVAINQGFIAMKCQDRLSSTYVWIWTAENMGAILENANGSTFQEISKSNFRPLPVIVPCKSIRQTYNQLAQPLYNHIVMNERQSLILGALRDVLLPRLISGELRAENADSFIKRAL